jgi:hypothetical protein
VIINEIIKREHAGVNIDIDVRDILEVETKTLRQQSFVACTSKSGGKPCDRLRIDELKFIMVKTKHNFIHLDYLT